jgi:transposase-like protein
MTEKLAANCPKCRTEMIYVTHLPHAQAPQMQRTTFVCYSCNRTRNYMLSTEMAAAYAQSGAPSLEAP